MSTLTKKHNKQPKLRFPMFSGDWKEMRLEEVFSHFKSGSGITSSKIKDFGNYPVYGGNGLRGYTDTFTHSGKYFLIGRQGALCGNIVNVEGDFFASEHAVVSQANDINDTSWLSKRLDYYNLNRLSESSAQPGLSVEKLRRVKLFVPTKQEQQKIADFLGSVDAWLDNLRQQKTTLETYKRGMMQKLFTQQVRFKDENGTEFPKWQKVKMSEIGSSFIGLSGKTAEDFGRGEPYITYKQIFDNSVIEPNNFSLVYVAPGEKQSRARRGDVLFTTSSETPEEVGFASVLIDDVRPYLNSFSFGFRPNSLNVLLPEYARYHFRSAPFRRMVVKLAQGSTRFNISKIQFMKLETTLPSAVEQRKIADFLTAIDQTITAKAEEINKVEQWKKGLMQKMFV